VLSHNNNRRKCPHNHQLPKKEIHFSSIIFYFLQLWHVNLALKRTLDYIVLQVRNTFRKGCRFASSSGSWGTMVDNEDRELRTDIFQSVIALFKRFKASSSTPANIMRFSVQRRTWASYLEWNQGSSITKFRTKRTLGNSGFSKCKKINFTRWTENMNNMIKIKQTYTVHTTTTTSLISLNCCQKYSIVLAKATKRIGPSLCINYIDFMVHYKCNYIILHENDYGKESSNKWRVQESMVKNAVREQI